MRKLLLAIILPLLSVSMPLLAQAQDMPSYAETDSTTQDEQIHGRVVSFDGCNCLKVRDDRGYVDTVQLHPGTIINPRGLSLQTGMVVSVLGYNAGNFFAANEIDTPYSLNQGVAYYSGHPWFYYGLAFGLGYFFGNTSWWHHGGYASSQWHSASYSYNEHPRPYYRSYAPQPAYYYYNPGTSNPYRVYSRWGHAESDLSRMPYHSW